MLNSHSGKAFLLLRICHSYSYSYKVNLLFSTTTTVSISDTNSFTVSYLINKCGFSPESARKFSHSVNFNSPTKPDSVIAFFTAQGFTPSQIRAVVQRHRRILLSDPDKILLPKFHFLRSKGASTADIFHIVTTGPGLLTRSLHNHIIPTYHFLHSFLNSDQQILTCLNRNASFISDGRFVVNAQMLLHSGVNHSCIAKLLRMWPSVICSSNLSDTVRELKELGFDPSTYAFIVALIAKRTVNKTKWGEKVETFKKWGWSEEDVVAAFQRKPYCMLVSPEKIDAVLSFWVDEYGGHASELVKTPVIFQLSLRRTLLPRAAVLRFLVNEGLRNHGASMVLPFRMTDQVFLDKFVLRFQNHSSTLLKIYEESLNVVGD